MARESGELGLYSIPILPQAFGMAREGSELGLTLLTILPQAFGMARENSKLGLNPGRYRRGIRAQVVQFGYEVCCFTVFWFWK